MRPSGADCGLDARLTPQIRHLLEAINQVLVRESIAAPLMIVKAMAR